MMAKFNVGDKVKVLREWNEKDIDSYLHWNYRMTDTIGKVGVVTVVDIYDVCVTVSFPDSHSAFDIEGWGYIPDVLELVETSVEPVANRAKFYRKKPETVYAVQFTGIETTAVPGGLKLTQSSADKFARVWLDDFPPEEKTVFKGEWIVVDSLHKILIYSDLDFKKIYELI